MLLRSVKGLLVDAAVAAAAAPWLRDAKGAAVCGSRLCTSRLQECLLCKVAAAAAAPRRRVAEAFRLAASAAAAASLRRLAAVAAPTAGIVGRNAVGFRGAAELAVSCGGGGGLLVANPRRMLRPSMPRVLYDSRQPPSRRLGASLGRRVILRGLGRRQGPTPHPGSGLGTRDSGRTVAKIDSSIIRSGYSQENCFR